MSRNLRLLAALLMLAAACSDRPVVTPPETPGTDYLTGENAASAGPPAVRGPKPERLAWLVARALADSGFRAYLKSELDGSPYREHKLHFQRLLSRGAGRARDHIARATGAAPDDVMAEAASAMALEIYLPVPAHREAWKGGEDVLVATAVHDREPPVAFDPKGRRMVLSPDEPPSTPVIALVPVETNFDVAPSGVQCYEDCGGGGGGWWKPPAPAPGLYMTKAHFVDDFEGWLKGSPEFEAHILGQKGQTDSLTSYQCAGEHAGGAYAFDQNGKDWSGSVLLFSATQIAQYNTGHPNQNFRVFFVEDDDGACVIRLDPDRINKALQDLEAAYPDLTAGNDSSNVFGKWYRRARGGQKIWAAIASLINTNDEFIGNAIEDMVVGQFYPGYNWFVKAENTVTNGWVNLVMK